MMLKSTSLVLAFGVMGSVALAVMPVVSPAFAQNDPNGAQAYAAGVKLGRTLHNPQQCADSAGDYHQGCLDGVEESRFDLEADQAMDSATGDTKPADRAPVLSPPPDLFPQPFSKPDNGQPPNN
jgi:hypothetical protein